jgi:hypothetical protein
VQLFLECDEAEDLADLATMLNETHGIQAEIRSDAVDGTKGGDAIAFVELASSLTGSLAAVVSLWFQLDDRRLLRARRPSAKEAIGVERSSEEMIESTIREVAEISD